MSEISEACLAYGARLGSYTDFFEEDAYKRDAVPALRQEIDEEGVFVDLAGMHPNLGYPSNCSVLLVFEKSKIRAWDAVFGVTKSVDPERLSGIELSSIEKEAFRERAHRVANKHFEEVDGEELEFEWILYGQ